MAITSKLKQLVSKFFDNSTDYFYENNQTVRDPARGYIAITPADADFETPFRGVYVGGYGNIVIRGIDNDDDVILYNVQSGTILDMSCKRIGVATTATNLVGLL